MVRGVSTNLRKLLSSSSSTLPTYHAHRIKLTNTYDDPEREVHRDRVLRRSGVQPNILAVTR